MPTRNPGSPNRGHSFMKRPCNWRLPARDPIDTGCTINESGYCHKLDCPQTNKPETHFGIQEHLEADWVNFPPCE